MKCCKGGSTVKGRFNVSIPVGNLPKSTGYNARTNPRSAILARYVPSGQGGGTGEFDLTASIYSPSNRLRVMISLFFEPDTANSPDPAFIQQPTWSIRSIAQNPETGKESPLQLAYPAPGGLSATANLPDAYEMDTAVKILRVNATLMDTNFSTSYVSADTPVNVVLVATWEPNTPIPDDERDFLYGLCSIQAQKAVLIQNNAA